MNLNEWLKKEGQTKRWFAKKIDVAESTVHRVLKNKWSFTHEIIERVIIATQGEVRPDSFFNIDELVGKIKETT